MYKPENVLRQAYFCLPTNSRYAAWGMHKSDIPVGTACFCIREDSDGLLWIRLDSGINGDWAIVDSDAYPYRNYDELHKYFSSISYAPDNLDLEYNYVIKNNHRLRFLSHEEVVRNWQIQSFEELFHRWLTCYKYNKASKYDEELLELETDLLKRIEDGWDSPDITWFTAMTIPNNDFTNAVLEYCAKGST